MFFFLGRASRMCFQKVLPRSIFFAFFAMFFCLKILLKCFQNVLPSCVSSRCFPVALLERASQLYFQSMLLEHVFRNRNRSIAIVQSQSLIDSSLLARPGPQGVASCRTICSALISFARWLSHPTAGGRNVVKNLAYQHEVVTFSQTIGVCASQKTCALAQSVLTHFLPQIPTRHPFVESCRWNYCSGSNKKNYLLVSLTKNCAFCANRGPKRSKYHHFGTLTSLTAQKQMI